MTGEEHVCGLHRGKVVAVRNSGFLLVQVPTLLGMTPIEAQPCRDPGVTAVPSPGDGVWISFEAGDIESPVWLGVWE